MCEECIKLEEENEAVKIIITKKPRNYWNLQTMNQYCIDENNKYKVLDVKREFISGKKHMYALVKCDNKTHEAYWILWHLFIRKHKCKQCYYESKNITTWMEQDIIDFFVQHELRIIDVKQWTDVDGGMDCIDKEGFKYSLSITRLRQNKILGARFHRKNPFSLYNIKLFCSLYRLDYEILSEEYLDIKTEYLWRYNGNELPLEEEKTFKTTADCFINGYVSHPYFSNSKGSKLFEILLKDNNIKYKKEKTFKKCKDKILLRFDFYLSSTNEVVEIDGIQHNKIVEFYGGIEGYNDRVRKDNIKNKYCKENKIKITRIPYNPNRMKEYKRLIDSKITEILSVVAI